MWICGPFRMRRMTTQFGRWSVRPWCALADAAVESIVICITARISILELQRADEGPAPVRNKRVYIVHRAPRGSPREKLLSQYATKAYHVQDVFNTDTSRGCRF